MDPKNQSFWRALGYVRGLSRRKLGFFLEEWRGNQKVDFFSFLAEKHPFQLDWEKVEKDSHWCSHQGIEIMGLWDPRYPSYLKNIYDPPLALYLKGCPKSLSEPMLGIVGSRRPTALAEAAAFSFAKDLASHFVIVSGLAVGIDAAAHRGALSSVEGGKTIAVLGSGLAQIYPRAHYSLVERIAEKGLIISEYPPFAPPLAVHFPDRNRIISGLSKGLFVVEAGLKSGSLITARLALEQNREVMALPGLIANSLTCGTHRLIQEGALLVTEPQDIINALS
jgi:DNA processing protein